MCALLHGALRFTQPPSVIKPAISLGKLWRPAGRISRDQPGCVLELFERYRATPGSVDGRPRRTSERWSPLGGIRADAVGRRPRRSGGPSDRRRGRAPESISRYGHLPPESIRWGTPPGDPLLLEQRTTSPMKISAPAGRSSAARSHRGGRRVEAIPRFGALLLDDRL